MMYERYLMFTVCVCAFNEQENCVLKWRENPKSLSYPKRSAMAVVSA